MTNSQKPERILKFDDGSLEVHSIFSTIQGEGPFAGEPAIFVRLAGCNLQCPHCDTDYSSSRRRLSPDDIVGPKKLDPAPLVVITGGEPFRQNIRPLVDKLLEFGYRVQIETNGTLFQELPWDRITVVCSPKTGDINEKLTPHIAAFKYVLNAESFDPEDGLPLRVLDHSNNGRVARPPAGFKGKIYLQPVDDSEFYFGTDLDRHVRAVTVNCIRFGYTLGLQLHKIIGMD